MVGAHVGMKQVHKAGVAIFEFLNWCSNILKALNFCVLPYSNRKSNLPFLQVINRLEDQIPDFFKEPNFLERLET